MSVSLPRSGGSSVLSVRGGRRPCKVPAQPNEIRPSGSNFESTHCQWHCRRLRPVAAGPGPARARPPGALPRAPRDGGAPPAAPAPIPGEIRNPPALKLVPRVGSEYPNYHRESESGIHDPRGPDRRRETRDHWGNPGHCRRAGDFRTEHAEAGSDQSRVDGVRPTCSCELCTLAE